MQTFEHSLPACGIPSLIRRCNSCVEGFKAEFSRSFGVVVAIEAVRFDELADGSKLIRIGGTGEWKKTASEGDYANRDGVSTVHARIIAP